jgi:chromosome segregation ATPase
MTATTATLFNLTAEWMTLVEAIEAADGALTEETEAALRQLTDALADKVDGYGQVIHTLDLQITGYEDRIKAFQTAIRARRRTIDRLDERLIEAMQRMGTRKLAGDLYTAALRESQAVRVEDEAAIPSAFWRQPPPEIDRAAIHKELRTGGIVPGASLEVRPFVMLR